MKRKKNNNDELTKEMRTLLNHIMLINRKCKENGLWLSAGHDPYKPLTDEEQQGPLVTKLFELTKNLRIILNRR
jgi:hypothetical protein